jgi:hypothetical protein
MAGLGFEFDSLYTLFFRFFFGCMPTLLRAGHRTGASGASEYRPRKATESIMWGQMSLKKYQLPRMSCLVKSVAHAGCPFSVTGGCIVKGILLLIYHQ